MGFVSGTEDLKLLGEKEELRTNGVKRRRSQVWETKKNILLNS
jgi:hypothetical protein